MTASKEATLRIQESTPQERSKAQPEARPMIVEDSMERNLNNLLANEMTLFMKTLKFHWNVTGPRFYTIHEFLENHYKELLNIIDDLAEQVRKIKCFPIGTLSEVTEYKTIMESIEPSPDSQLMISELLNDHNSVRQHISMMIENKEELEMSPSTEDFLTNLMKTHDEMAWMLRSSLN
jgi:starvation-inducible DNA-binding protein